MSRTAASMLGLLGLAIASLSFGQTGSSQATSPQTNSSQAKDRRLEAAEVDIALLKRLVREQGRRIAELEKNLKALQTANAEAPAAREPPTAHEVAKTIKPLGAPWHDPLAWTQLREGMSRAQVDDILGKPTSVEAVIDHQTMVYKGDVPGSGTVTGIVKLTDDRVSEVTLPKF